MKRISYKRHRFPPAIIQYAVWLYFRFTLSLRDVGDMLAHRGVDVRRAMLSEHTANPPLRQLQLRSDVIDAGAATRGA